MLELYTDSAGEFRFLSHGEIIAQRRVRAIIQCRRESRLIELWTSAQDYRSAASTNIWELQEGFSKRFITAIETMPHWHYTNILLYGPKGEPLVKVFDDLPVKATIYPPYCLFEDFATDTLMWQLCHTTEQEQEPTVLRSLYESSIRELMKEFCHTTWRYAPQYTTDLADNIIALAIRKSESEVYNDFWDVVRGFGD